MTQGKLYENLHSTCVYGIFHKKPLSLEIDDILDEAKADFPKFAFMVPELAEAKINTWFEKWFGDSK